MTDKAQEPKENRDSSLFTEVTICGWDQLLQVYKDKGFDRVDKEHNWIFRGQQTPKVNVFVERSIKGSFEKAIDLYQPKVNPAELENRLIRSFQRRAHLYVTQPPPEDDIVVWLSLMRHYGGPTRLLDWTYSFYAAVYFAVNKCNCNDSKAEIWALNAKWLDRQNENQVFWRLLSQARHAVRERGQQEDFDTEVGNEVVRRLYREPKLGLYQVTPFRQNERITAQQGTFIFPGVITRDCQESRSSAKEKGVFFANLRAYDTKNVCEHLYRLVLDICQQQRNVILEELYTMNINQAVLFPDLVGFAESLKRHIAYPTRKYPNIRLD